MPFDGIVTHAVTEELKPALIGGRINKIYQPTKTEVVITIRNKRTNHVLLLSIHPSYARFHLTEDTYKNPTEPPMFCMVLRKHLAGAIIENMKQFDSERIVSIHLKTMNEIGDYSNKTLQIEIMGRHSNVILLNEDQSKIIDCLKHVPPFQNRFRSLLPGADYTLPPSQNKVNLWKTDAETIVKRLDFNAGKLDQQFVQNIIGISRPVGKEIVHRAHLGSREAFIQVLHDLQQDMIESDFSPAIYRGVKEDFHVIPFTHEEKEKQFPNVSELLDAFYSNKAERDRVKQQAKDLTRIISNELNKNKRKLAIHETTLKKAVTKDDWQKKGELLTANMHLVKKGDAKVTVIDYYDPEQSEKTIDLRTDKTPSENAQIFFKRYRKLTVAEKNAATEIKKTNAEIDYLEAISAQIENARDEDIADIREELAEEGYIKKQKRRKRKKNKPTPEQFTATDGTPILVGRNNAQNEYATHKMANKNDIWLHTLQIPGSHVIIQSDNPSEQTLLEAAQLAAYYSKARDSASVPVDYTKVKHVKKPAGAKPGFVTYTDQKTVYVTPSKQQVENKKL